MTHAQKVRHTIARLTEIHSEGLKLAAELAFLLGGSDKGDLGTILHQARTKAPQATRPAAPVRLSKTTSIEVAPAGKRFRRTQEELDLGLTVEQAIQRRADLVAQGLPPIKSSRVRPAAAAAVAPVKAAAPARRKAVAEIAEKAVRKARPRKETGAAAKTAKAPRAAKPASAPHKGKSSAPKSRKSKVHAGAPHIPAGLFGEQVGGSPNITAVTPGVEGFSG